MHSHPTAGAPAQLLGTFRECVSSYTIAGLAAVMLGFACYQHQQPHSQTTPPRKPMQPIITSGAGEAERMPSALSESLLGAQGAPTSAAHTAGHDIVTAVRASKTL